MNECHKNKKVVREKKEKRREVMTTKQAIFLQLTKTTSFTA